MVTFFNKTKKIFKVILFGIFIISFLNSCGIYKKSDARTVPPDAKSKVKKILKREKVYP